MQKVRWALILPGAIAAWYLAFLIGIALHEGLNMLCPPELVVSGICEASWYPGAERGLVAFGAGLAAVLVMIACTLIAPTNKRGAAIGTFATGSIVAIALGWTELLVPMVAAITAGALVLVFLLRKDSPFSLPNTALERTRDR
jgi:hypothetical protein